MKTNHTFVKLLAVLALGCGHKATGPTPVAEPPPAPAPEPEPDRPPQPAGQELTLADVGLDAAAIDKSTNPCDDFYRYACGRWIQSTEIPADRSRWSRSFSVIDQQNREALRAILEDAARDPQSKIGAFYAACMDEAAVEAQGLEPIAPLLGRIQAAKSAKAFHEIVFEMHRHRMWVFFDIGVEQDFKDATRQIAYLDQNGMALPEKDYYLNEKFKEKRDAYQAHVERLLVVAGWKAEDARRAAADVLRVETELARASLSAVERRDPQKIYNKIDRAGLKKAAPSFPWDAYLAALGRPDVTDIAVTSPTYVAAMAKLIKTAKPAQLRSYLAYHAIAEVAPTLGKAYQDEAFALAQALTGQKKIEDRWKRCVRATDAALGELLAQPYVEKHFGGDSKTAAEQMVAGVSGAFGENLLALAWMDDETRAQALAKLKSMSFKIGYPSKWKEYDWAIDGRSYAKNVLASRAYELARTLKKIGQPVDRTEWGMTPPTVNAYYNPLMNEMAFPAGILQPPFYQASHPWAVNLGAMGWVVGHELTHGFDDQGSQFDADGNMRNWWQAKVGEQFKARAQCVKDQYAKYEPLPGLKVNGDLTAGENIADIGGVKFAFRAYRALRKGKEPIVAEGYTEDQLFFLAGAQAWCSKSTDDAMRMMVQSDPHSPPEFRVNGAFTDNPEFAEAWSCPVGSKMNPKDRCEVW